jgi:hypothetical protein
MVGVVLSFLVPAGGQPMAEWRGNVGRLCHGGGFSLRIFKHASASSLSFLSSLHLFIISILVEEEHHTLTTHNLKDKNHVRFR